MSADILRRAAKTLRRHAEAAAEGPWTYEGDDGGESIGAGDPDSPDVVMVYSHNHYEDNGTMALGHVDGQYVALMAPPVALALADWLDLFAEICDWPSPVDEVWPDAGKALAVAREILREAPDA